MHLPTCLPASLPPRQRRALSVVAILLWLMPCAPGIAADTLVFNAGVSVRHDDNLFRLSPDADTQALIGTTNRADTVTRTTVGIKFDKTYSLQRFELEAGLQDYRYSRFDYLDFTARNYAAAWGWSLTPRLHGKLSGQRQQALNSFIDYTGYGTRNVRTDEVQRFDATYEAAGGWRLLGGAARLTRRNSKAFNQEGDNRLDTVEAGVGYDFSSGVALRLTRRQGRGEYDNRPQPLVASLLDNRFEQRENDVHLTLPLTAKTTVDARAAYLERSHEHFSERDYSGPVGQVTVNWRLSDKTAVNVAFGRELSSFQSTSASYIETDRLTISPSWQMSAKTSLRGRYDYAWRDYRGAITAAGAARADAQQSLLLTLEWQALRDLALSATLQNERRSSNLAGNDFQSTVAGVSAQLSF